MMNSFPESFFIVAVVAKKTPFEFALICFIDLFLEGGKRGGK